MARREPALAACNASQRRALAARQRDERVRTEERVRVLHATYAVLAKLGVNQARFSAELARELDRVEQCPQCARRLDDSATPEGYCSQECAWRAA